MTSPCWKLWRGRTCALWSPARPTGSIPHRLLVRGHRVENREDGVMRIIADAMQIDPRFVAPVIGAPILLAALLVMILRPLRRRKRKG